jgi:hypothetical protein
MRIKDAQSIIPYDCLVSPSVVYRCVDRVLQTTTATIILRGGGEHFIDEGPDIVARWCALIVC